MFIKLHFIDELGSVHPRAIKTSRIQEVRSGAYGEADRLNLEFQNGRCQHRAEVLISGNPEFQRVKESFDEIFGIIEPSDEPVEV